MSVICALPPRNSLRREFFHSVIARLTPVQEDYDQFILRENFQGDFRLCVEMTGIFSGERPWYLIADEKKATMWRGSETEEYYWDPEVEGAVISDTEHSRAKGVVVAFKDFMNRTISRRQGTNP